MREKIISISLMLLIILVIPIFITTILTGIRSKKEEFSDIMVNINYSGEETQIPLEEYIIGVVAAEMPAQYDKEALKAQAIAARTYTLKKIDDDKKVIFTSDIQGYESYNDLENKWGAEEFPIYYVKIKDAVESTRGYVMTYNNELIDAVYHSISSGTTRSALDVWGKDVDYLQKVESLEDINSPEYINRYKISYMELKDKLTESFNDIKVNISKENEMQIVERSEEGYIKKIQFENKILTGEEIRNSLSIASSNFTLDYKEDNIEIICKGYGHGVGMSQYGANAMAKEGKTYDKILKHYYVGIDILIMKQ